jgi:hypothetical protein
MAQHDYVISNGTGAAVRSDLNNALLAIVSQNSGATEPTTTYAYQWWADTTTGLLKIRNSSNNAWIELMQLDGTLTMEDGTVSAPGLAFRDDLNTGIWRPGTDQFAISTNGVERVEWGTSEVVFNDGGANYDFRVEGDTNANLLFVDASADAIGVGTSSPAQVLDVQANDARFNLTSTGSGQTVGISIKGGAGGGDTYNFIESLNSSGTQTWYMGSNGTANSLTFKTNGNNPRLTIDSSGRVGVGSTSPQTILHAASTAPYIRIQDTDSSTGVTAQGGFELYDSDGDRIFYLANESSSSADVSLFNNAGGALKFGTSGSERAQIDSSGRLLVGTSSAPTGTNSQYAKLSVIGNSGDATSWGALNLGIGSAPTASNSEIGRITFTNNVAGEFATIQGFTDATAGTNDYPGRLVFSTTADGASSPTEWMRITSAGILCINRTSQIAGAQFCLDYTNGTTAGLAIRDTQTTGTGVVLHVLNGSGTIVGQITQNQSATTYATSSDYRLKENIELVTDATDRVKALKPCRFNFISDPDKTVDGFIAHEAQEVVPECVTGEKDAVDDEGNPIYQGIDQSKLVPLLTAALQEAVAKIESLEARLTAAGI